MYPDDASGYQPEIGFTRTVINAMCDMWGLATEWRNDLNSMKVCYGVRSIVHMLTKAGIPPSQS
jgi:hypothetical protein